MSLGTIVDEEKLPTAAELIRQIQAEGFFLIVQHESKPPPRILKPIYEGQLFTPESELLCSEAAVIAALRDLDGLPWRAVLVLRIMFANVAGPAKVVDVTEDIARAWLREERARGCAVGEKLPEFVEAALEGAREMPDVPEPLKFCKDCAHYLGDGYCGVPRNPPFDLVTGEPNRRRASIERAYPTDDSCTAAAIWFKPITDTTGA